MSNLIEFPKNRKCDTSIPNYAGHVLMLDLNKARKWQCFNFWVGSRNKMAVVPDDTSMDRIHEAVQAGILLDITEHPELFVPERPIAEVVETDTGKKIYSGTAQFFHDLGIFEPGYDPDKTDLYPDELVAYATEDSAEKEKIEQALASLSVVQAEPVSLAEARQRASRPLLVLPIGMDTPDRYLLQVHPL